jgi:hypothetical protein
MLDVESRDQRPMCALAFLPQRGCLVEPGVVATEEPLPREGSDGPYNPEAGCLGRDGWVVAA